MGWLAREAQWTGAAAQGLAATVQGRGMPQAKGEASLENSKAAHEAKHALVRARLPFLGFRVQGVRCTVGGTLREADAGGPARRRCRCCCTRARRACSAGGACSRLVGY